MSETTDTKISPDFFRDQVTNNECVNCENDEATRVNVYDVNDVVCGTCYRNVPRVDQSDYIFISDVPKRPVEKSQAISLYLDPAADFGWGLVDDNGAVIGMASIAWVDGALSSINDLASEISSVFNVAASSAEDDGYERLTNGMRTFVRPNGNDGELLRVSIIVDKFEKVTRQQAEEWVEENEI